MAAARLDLPTVFLTGGPSEMVLRQRKTSCSSVNFPDHSDPADQMGCLTSGSCGACEIIGTANTFQCIAEALGMTLPGSANIPGYTADKARVARACGRQIVKNVQEGLTARQIMTKESLINALLLVQAVGGSTNTALHLPAIARELGLELTLEEFNVAAKKVPTLCAIAPNGPYGVLDLYRSGGVPGVLKRIAEDLDLNCGNTFGGTLQDVVANAQITDENVIPERSNCHYPEGGLVALFGNLAPEGSVVKQSAVDPNMYKFSGPARIFESEHACLEAIRNKTIQEGEVVVIRNEGPKGGPGMPETLAVTIGLKLLGLQRVALITDGRFSGATSGPCVGHVSPEAADGGPIAALDDGDIIRIDIPSRAIAVELSDEALKERLASRKPSPHAPVDGYMQRYVSTVTSAAKGAVLEKP